MNLDEIFDDIEIGEDIIDNLNTITSNGIDNTIDSHNDSNVNDQTTANQESDDLSNEEINESSNDEDIVNHTSDDNTNDQETNSKTPVNPDKEIDHEQNVQMEAQQYNELNHERDSVLEDEGESEEFFDATSEYSQEFDTTTESELDKNYKSSDHEEEISSSEQQISFEKEKLNIETKEDVPGTNEHILRTTEDIVGDENNELMNKLHEILKQPEVVEQVDTNLEQDVFKEIRKRTLKDSSLNKNKVKKKITKDPNSTKAMKQAIEKEIGVEQTNWKRNEAEILHEDDKTKSIAQNEDTVKKLTENTEQQESYTIHDKKQDYGNNNDWLKKDLQSLKHHNKKLTKERMLGETLRSNNIKNLPKVNVNQIYNKQESYHPKKVVKKKKIRLVYPLMDWEEGTSESRGEIKPNRRIRALFYKQAITNNDNLEEKVKYIEAYNKELNNLVTMDVIDLGVEIDKSKVPKDQIVNTNSLFNVKRDGTYKARIVCRGDQQAESSYSDIETSILNMDSLKLLLLLANNNKMRLRTLDINHAFLYADLEEKIYIPHPKKSYKVTPLKKSLYGLKQSPKRWNETLKEYMNSIGLYDNIYSPGLYTSKDCKTMIAAYVDDCIVAAETDEKLDDIINKLDKRFSLKIVGVMKQDILETDILGMDLEYDYKKGIVELGMESYITTLKDQYPELLQHDMKKENVPHIGNYIINPKSDELIMSKSEYKQKVKYLQELIGKLNYVRSRGRVDIEFAVGKMARLVLYPHKRVIETTEKILKYLYTNKEIKMKFTRERNNNNNYKITVVSDASLATEFDLKSRAGAIIWLGNNYFHGFSKKSSIVCESSAEAELDALNTGEKIALLLKLKLDKIVGPGNVKIDIITDSKPALDWLKQEYVKARTKFLGLRIERLKERIKDKQLNVRKIKGPDNVADPLTKPTSITSFSVLAKILQHEITPEMLLPITVLW